LLYVDEYHRLLVDGEETGIQVLKDSRWEIVPSMKWHTEEIPGRHGEIVFGVDVQPRMIELECAMEVSKGERGDRRHVLAGLLSPLSGDQELVFADDPGRSYYGRLSEAVPVEAYVGADKFTLAFKCSDPFAYGPEQVLVGSGLLTNEGNVETPLVIDISGPVENPTVKVGTLSITWEGGVASGDHLIIDSRSMTVTFNGVNATGAFAGDFPFLKPGHTEVVAASAGTTTWKFRNRWL